MLNKLDKHEWDPNCSFCMANPWLQETKQVADLLPKLIDEEHVIMSHIEYMESEIDVIEITNPKEKLQLYDNVNHSLGVIRKN